MKNATGNGGKKMKNKDRLLILAGIGAVVGYRAWRGAGSFNKIRFKKQRSALESYVDTHYPGASIGEIVPFREGWSCPVAYNGQNIIIYLIPCKGGGYIFSNTQM